MVRLKFSIDLNYTVTDYSCDFILNVHAAQTAAQTVVHESLAISQPVVYELFTDPLTHAKFVRFKASSGPLLVQYQATLDLDHHVAQPEQIAEVAVADLPVDALRYIFPSRYCQSDRLFRLAVKEFGHLPPGYSRVQAIRDWVLNHVMFRSNSSNSSTTAVDTLIDQVGVCRDFAHLMIALCRAVNVPARFATGIDYGADPVLGPTDFHAYVEVYLGARWYLFDPSGVAIPMGFVRFGTGKDAAETAFATMFGGVQGSAPVISIEAIPNAQGILVLPQHVTHALSTA